MTTSEALIHTLRTWHRLPAKQVLERLGVSRATLMRAVREAGQQVVSRGKARRTTYATRRAVRGSMEPLPVYRIDPEGQAHETALLHPTHPEGCVLDFVEPCAWPLMDAMLDGWFEGLPYMLDDLRPQGFLGRQFAQRHASLLQVSDDPHHWSEDDALHALRLLGCDQSGDTIVGEVAMRQWLAKAHAEPTLLSDAEAPHAYLHLAAQAMGQGTPGSSAGGEFPKFTAVRHLEGRVAHVIVKFSGSDGSPGTVRWSDLLVCEHLALNTVTEHLGLAAARSRIHQRGGRTFLEVERFDRHGLRGRSPMCSWAALNGALVGMAGRPWHEGGRALQQQGLLDAHSVSALHRLWLFGQLIANTDMHDGNLSFLPGLRLAPVYDMLPMAYAPVRGMELPVRAFEPARPLPSEREAWAVASQAAFEFWTQASQDARLSEAFRGICAQNASTILAVSHQ